MKSIAAIITVYRNPSRLHHLLSNIQWSGCPDIPIYIFEDPSYAEDRKEITAQYAEVCNEWNLTLHTASEWGCMQGIIQYAFEHTSQDWIIYIPDDIVFTKGALLNEYAAVLAYGRSFIGGIQAPYWNADELAEKGMMPQKDCMYNGWIPENIPHNPHWDYKGIPRKYVNLNGAGFSLNRTLWKLMGGWPKATWRLDEYAGYMSWKHRMAVITIPGPPRIHYFGGATHLMPENKPDFSSEQAWEEATGKSVQECGTESRIAMDRIPNSEPPDGTWNDILNFYTRISDGR